MDLPLSPDGYDDTETHVNACPLHYQRMQLQERLEILQH